MYDDDVPIIGSYGKISLKSSFLMEKTIKCYIIFILRILVLRENFKFKAGR